MKRSLLSICLLLALVAGALSAPAPTRAQNTLLVEGHVFMDGNRDGVRQAEEPGIAGVTVTISSAESSPVVAVTDLFGYYLVENLAPGSYLVRAEPPAGYQCATCQVEISLTENTPMPINLSMFAGAPWTPTPTNTPTTTPTATPTDTPSPLPTWTPAPTQTSGATKTPAPTPTPGNMTITFYATPARTRFPGDCAILYWWVDRATEIFLMLPSGQIGVEGTGQHQVCPETTTTYRLKVNGQNGRQETVDAQVVVPPPPTSTPIPPPKTNPTRYVPPTAIPTFTPEPTCTPTIAPTETPTFTPEPTWTSLPTATPVIDPLLAGLPVRWGGIEWMPSEHIESKGGE